MKRITVVVLLGMMWFGIGAFLLYKGIFLLVQAITFGDMKNQMILRLLQGIAPSQDQAALLLLSSALLLGMMKGRFVLAKTARKTVSKILQTPEPVPIKDIVTLKYILLVGFMISLGIMMNRSGLSYDIRCLIDVAVGSALVQGGMQYFRSATSVKLCGKKIP